MPTFWVELLQYGDRPFSTPRSARIFATCSSLTQHAAGPCLTFQSLARAGDILRGSGSGVDRWISLAQLAEPSRTPSLHTRATPRHRGKDYVLALEDERDVLEQRLRRLEPELDEVRRGTAGLEQPS